MSKRKDRLVGHKPGCPRSQFWDAGEWECPCTCGIHGVIKRTPKKGKSK